MCRIVLINPSSVVTMRNSSRSRSCRDIAWALAGADYRELNFFGFATITYSWIGWRSQQFVLVTKSLDLSVRSLLGTRALHQVGEKSNTNLIIRSNTRKSIFHVPDMTPSCELWVLRSFFRIQSSSKLFSICKHSTLIWVNSDEQVFEKFILFHKDKQVRVFHSSVPPQLETARIKNS